MKKQLLNLLTLCTIVLAACDPEVEPKTPAGKYAEGVLIINEGNFGSADGEISFYKPEVDSIYHDVFQAENEIPFAGILQSVFVHGPSAYLVDNLGSIRKVNSQTFKLTASLDEFSNPRDFVVAGGKGFVADWGPYAEDWTLPSSYVYIIDLETFEKTDSIAVASGPEHFLVVDDKVFVSSSAADIISVINVDNFSLETITVPYGPTEMVQDQNDKIWVVCGSDIVRISPFTLEVETEIPLQGDAHLSGDLEINSQGNQLYYITTTFNPDWTTSNAVYQLSISANTAPSSSIIEGTNLYGLGIDDQNLIYIADHKNYAGNGEVRIYSTAGDLQKTLQAGRIPSDFVFLP